MWVPTRTWLVGPVMPGQPALTAPHLITIASSDPAVVDQRGAARAGQDPGDPGARTALSDIRVGPRHDVPHGGACHGRDPALPPEQASAGTCDGSHRTHRHHLANGTGAAVPRL